MNRLDLAVPKIEFDKKAHRYSLNGNVLPSVTTLLGILDKPWLPKWMLNEMAGSLKNDLQADRSYTSYELDDIITRAKGASKKKSTDGMTSGSATHKWIEGYIFLRMSLLGELQGIDTSQVPPETQPAVRCFLEWERLNRVEWLASEMFVVSEIHGFAGTLDFVARINGKLTLGDFKTSNTIANDHFLQTAGYQVAFEEMDKEHKYPIEQRMIIQIPKGRQLFQALTVPTDFGSDKRTFISLLEIRRWLEYADDRRQRAGVVKWKTQ